MDLGANGLQTFRYVLLPELRSALVAGALLAFALSWDEVIVTIFTAGGNTDDPDLDLDGAAHGRQRRRDQRRRRGRRRPQHRAGVRRAAAHERRRRQPARRRTKRARSTAVAGASVGLMGVRGARRARPRACSPALASGLRHERLDAPSSPSAGPSGPATTLPRAEGALRLLVRQGYAEDGLGRGRSSAAPAARSRCATPTRRRGCAAAPTAGPSTSRRSRAASPTPSCRTAPRAGDQPRPRPTARGVPGALPRPRRRPRRRTPLRHRLPLDAAPRSGATASASTRRRPGRRSPTTPRRARGRVALEDTPLEIGDAAMPLRTLAPQLGITDPYALDETQFAAAVALDEAAHPPRRRALAAARRRDRRLRRRPRRRRRGRLVHGRADPRPERRRRPHAAARGRPRRDRPLDARARTRCIPAARTAGCATPRRRACRPRSRASTAPRPSAPAPAPNSGTRSAVPCTPTRPAAFLKRIAFRHTPVENCGGGRRCVPFAQWEQAWTQLRTS